MIEWISSLEPPPGWAALGGAILGAAAGYVAREIEDRRRRKSELKGLIKLIAVEIAHNDELIKPLLDSEHLKVPYGHVPSSRNWDKANVRFVQILEDDALIEDLTKYYEKSYQMNRDILGDYYLGDNKVLQAFERAQELKLLSDKVRPRLEELRAQKPHSPSRNG